MGLFSSKPSKAEVRAFGRGGKGSAKAAEAYAQQARDRAASRTAGKNLAAQSAAWKKKGK
jgi:hypothetical protein